MMKAIRNVGFIGTGNMGAPMAGHLLDAGYGLHVYNRTRTRADELCRRGAVWHDDPASLAEASDAVITIVDAPPDVERLYFGAILDRVKPGGVLIDMTTSSPRLAVRIQAAAAAKGLGALDAPVSGGQGGAQAATLAIMVGGERADFDRALPLLERIGRNIVHCGPAGRGQHMKLSNQVMVASNILAVVEGITFAFRGGIDAGTMMKVLSESTANSRLLGVYGQKVLAGDYAPGFFIDHFIKDMTIALDEADSLGLDLRALRNALAMFEELRRRFSGEEGIQAIARLYA
ncbi:MAG: NAD(P)-dependent oxidoreductase [Deltaproteobacteria bacterium]|nr:NAD(P)-dependent oxidoreductase [Deltaproteobacteria bacterium]